MANRVMAAKVRKMRMQNRKLPRRLSLNVKGPRPAMEVLADYRQRVRSLGKDEVNLPWQKDGYALGMGIKNTVPKMEIALRSEEILKKFDTPHFFEVRNDATMRLRVYFDPTKTKVSIEQHHYLLQVVRTSQDFSSLDDATFAIANNIVPWATEQPFQCFRDQAEASG